MPLCSPVGRCRRAIQARGDRLWSGGVGLAFWRDTPGARLEHKRTGRGIRVSGGTATPPGGYAATCTPNDCNFTPQGPRLLNVLVIFSSPRRETSWANSIQYSATFSYAFLMTGSLACAARCLASSALLRQVSPTEAPGAPVSPHEIMVKQGRLLPVEYWADPF